MMMKLANLDSLTLSEQEPNNSKTFISGTEKYFVVLQQQIDVAAERTKLNTELEYQRGFVRSVEAKLSNERFVSGAPAAVVESERKKLADGIARIAILEESIAKLN
jgi:valyl-tRNA synthetase